MSSSKIRYVYSDSPALQNGYGVPNHIEPLGSIYVDNNDGVVYVNKDGLNYWERFINNNDDSMVIGTISATSLNTVDYIVFNTGTTSLLSNSTGVTQSSGFTILSNLSTLNAANDAGAAVLGVLLYGLYRSGNVVRIRIT